MSSGRQDWELADGPVVGQDVPITSEPREENATGEPVAPEVPDTEDGDADSGDELVEKHEAPKGDLGNRAEGGRGDTDKGA